MYLEYTVILKEARNMVFLCWSSDGNEILMVLLVKSMFGDSIEELLTVVYAGGTTDVFVKLFSHCI